MARSAAAAALGAAPGLARPPRAYEPECEADNPLAAPEWTMPARRLAWVALAAVAACGGWALLA